MYPGLRLYNGGSMKSRTVDTTLPLLPPAGSSLTSFAGLRVLEVHVQNNAPPPSRDVTQGYPEIPPTGSVHITFLLQTRPLAPAGCPLTEQHVC